MPFSQERLAYLLELYSSRKATAAEEQELFALVKENDVEGPVIDHIRELITRSGHRELLPAVDWESVYRQIEEKTGAAEEEETLIVPRRRIWPRIVAAACLLLMAGTGIYYFWNVAAGRKELADSEVKKAPVKEDVSPGINGAILTLSNGQQVVLDSAGSGTLAMQGNAKLQNQRGQLSYYNETGERGAHLIYNTMTTTRGRQYQLVLADGTKVWLNAASSITYPTTFNGRQRKVAITGEAYFEIAKDAARPFSVSANGMEIQVLGTQFNINAYDDEEHAKTTLFEGSVKLVKNNASTLLTPGQQAQINRTGKIKVIDDADLEEALAWKEGLFIMKKADIGSIMRQIARWYDVEIVYPEGVPAGRISGDMPRNMNLSKVLEVLELSGVHCSIEGKRVEVKQ
jgi:ferric-dicitrate binding protein FerR (iron transport regulator)